MPPRPWLEFPHLHYGGAGEETRMVCGYLRGDAILFDPVLRALPPMFVVHPPAGPAATWLAATVEYAMTGAPPGSDGGGATNASWSPCSRRCCGCTSQDLATPP